MSTIFYSMSLLAARIIKNSHILAEIYFVFLSKRPGPKLKVFQYRIWSSVKEESETTCDYW